MELTTRCVDKRGIWTPSEVDPLDPAASSLCQLTAGAPVEREGGPAAGDAALDDALLLESCVVVSANRAKRCPAETRMPGVILLDELDEAASPAAEFDDVELLPPAAAADDVGVEGWNGDAAFC